MLGRMSMATDPEVSAWLADNPAWSGWLAAQDALWERALELRERGCTLPQAYSALGLLPEAEPEITSMGQLPPRLQDHLLGQARAQLIGELRRANLEQWPVQLRERVAELVPEDVRKDVRKAIPAQPDRRGW
jgi:hypothetical protein